MEALKISSQRINLIKLTHYYETRKEAYNSQVVKAKENQLIKALHQGHQVDMCTN